MIIKEFSFEEIEIETAINFDRYIFFINLLKLDISFSYYLKIFVSCFNSKIV
jgi:hypothetical protein